MWVASAIAAAITASLVTIFGKLGLKNIDSTLATTVRACIMAFSLVLLSLSSGKLTPTSLSQFSSKDWLIITLSGLAGAASWLFYFFALKTGAAPKVAAIDRTSLVFIVVLSAIFLGESVTWRTIGGALLIVGGTLLITWK